MSRFLDLFVSDGSHGKGGCGKGGGGDLGGNVFLVLLVITIVGVISLGLSGSSGTGVGSQSPKQSNSTPAIQAQDV